MRKILIAGDSWGCGEWAILNSPVWTWNPAFNNARQLSMTGGHGVIHFGLEEYFSEQNLVLNTSVPAATNQESILRLTRGLVDFDAEMIIWIQTDPIRDYRGLDNYRTLLQEEWSLERFTEIHTHALENSYRELNSIGVPILCLGGTTKIDNRIKSYKNLNPVIPSMIEFINTDLCAPKFWISEWIQQDIVFNHECLAQLERDKLLMDILCRDSYFSFCGHPKRAGLRKVFEYLNEKN